MWELLYIDIKGRSHYAVKPEPDSEELWDCVELRDGTLKPIERINNGNSEDHNRNAKRVWQKHVECSVRAENQRVAEQR